MLKKKKILITGTTSGLGYCLEEYFSKYNQVITINKRSVKKKNFVNKLNYIVDITNYKKVESLLKKLKKKKIFPDILILNAGINIYDNKSKFIYHNFMKCFNVNFIGAMNFVGALEKLKFRNKTIIFISSASNFFPNPATIGYHLSKISLKKITKFLNLNKFNKYKYVVIGAMKTNIARYMMPQNKKAKLLHNFLKIKKNKVAIKIDNFALTKKESLYISKISIFILILLSLFFKFFPFLYRGGRADN